jgi:hypothetical protein
MNDKTWARYGALGGIWFVVLMVIGVIVAGAPPSRNDPASEIAKFYADNDSAIQLMACLAALGVIGLVWWFGTLWRDMADAEGGTPRLAIIALIGLVLSGIGAMVGFIVDAGTAAAIDMAGEGSAIFFHISNVSFGFSAMGDVILTAAVGGLIIRSGFLPRWVGYLSYAVAVLSLVGVFSIASDQDVLNLFVVVATLLWAAWIVVIAVLEYQKGATD